MTDSHIDESSTEGTLNTHTGNTEAEKTESGNTEDSTSKFQEFFSEIIETQNAKMNNTLLTFLELKNIDEELTEIEEEKGDLPELIESIKSKIETIDSQLEEKKKALSKLDSEKIKLENDNSLYEEKINKYDEQKFNVRSNKEYDEIGKAIDSLFDEVEKNESRIKEIAISSGTLSSDIEALDNKVRELKTELTEKQTLLDELNEQYRQDESVLREKRNKLTSKLDPQSSSLYERINNSYKGEATAIVRKGNCSGCYNSIPPQRVIEIKTAEKIFTCQSCGRILISEELVTT